MNAINNPDVYGSFMPIQSALIINQVLAGIRLCHH